MGQCKKYVFLALTHRFVNGQNESVFVPEGGCGDHSFGFDHMGETKGTASGYDCQRWDSQTPHTHSLVDAANFPDDSLAEASNYCRQYHGADVGYIWCHTTNPNIRWEYCSVHETRCGEQGSLVE